MARRSIYVPNWLHRKLVAVLPADETVSGVACEALQARVHREEGCDHDGPRLCAHCHQVVDP